MEKRLTAILQFLFLIFPPMVVNGQVNKILKIELDSIYRRDQLYREIAQNSVKKDSLGSAHQFSKTELEQHIFRKMTEIDSSNIKRIKRIIELHGYPGTSLVGSPTNEVAWYVIQHSNDIKLFFPLIELAGQKKELPFRLVATMQDRLLVNQNQEQLYGTQIRCDKKGGMQEQSVIMDCYVWPISDALNVNERRKKAGFDQSVEENAKRLGFTYEVRKLPKK